MDYKVYMCVVCGFIYEEEYGLPEEGIPVGTRWEEIPDTWMCPDCSALKDDFDMLEI
jgi:rubredoxin